MKVGSALLCYCEDPNCPGQVSFYYPFNIVVDMVSDATEDAELYLTVRTSSFDFDGERTDIHDVLSLLWAATLRVREIASARLVTVLNPVTRLDSEIYARYLLLAQPGALRAGLPLKPRAEALSRESAYMHTLINTVFGGRPASNDRIDRGYSDSPSRHWIDRVCRRLRCDTSKDCEVRARSYPNWTYFGSNKRGVTLVEIGALAAAALKHAFASFNARSVEGVHAMLFRSDQYSNAARKETLARLAWFVKQVDGKASPLFIVPTDSHVIAIGDSCIAAIRDMAGRDQFEAERTNLRARRAAEAALLNEDHVCRWAEVIDDARFEKFVGELLGVERGVQRVRQVGATREPDDGRDFLVDWMTAPDRGGVAWKEPNMPLSEMREILVQVKVRRTGVGRSDLPGLRDTLDHHRSDGLLIVAFPRVTAQLMNHLTELRRRGQWWVDWWGQTELEERVRRQPEIAGRFPDIVRLAQPPTRSCPP